MLYAILESLIYVMLLPQILLLYLNIYSLPAILASIFFGTALTYTMFHQLEKHEEIKKIFLYVAITHLVILLLIFVGIVLCFYILKKHFRLSLAETLATLFSSYLIPFVFSISIIAFVAG